MDTDSPAGPDPAALFADLTANGTPWALAERLVHDPDYLASHAMGDAQQRDRETLDVRRAHSIAELRPATPRERLTEARRITREIAANNDHPLALAHPRQQRDALAHARREVARHHAAVRRSSTHAPRRTCTGQRRPGARRIARANAPPGGGDPPDGEHEPLGSTTAPLPAGRDRPPADHTTRLGVVA